jgi:hypothetical protein
MREADQTIELKLLGRLEDTYQFGDDGTMRLPFMSETNLITSAVVMDGQTVAMLKKLGDQQLVILVTTTLMDPAGNRLH